MSIIHKANADKGWQFIEWCIKHHIHEKLTGREKCCRKDAKATRMTAALRKSQFKNIGGVHKEWAEAGVSASKTTMHRQVEKICLCHIPSVKPLKCLTWAKEKMNLSIAQ